MNQHVYFARCLSPWGTPMGALKIGCSGVPSARVKAVALNQPYSLELIVSVPGGFVQEALVHMYLRKHRIAGEFFHENAVVMRYVDEVERRKTAFYWMDASASGDHLPAGAFEGFLKFHGLTLEQCCAYLGRDPKTAPQDLSGFKNTKYIAAAMMLAQTADEYGRFALWPQDAVRGLLGLAHRNVVPLIEQDRAA